MLMQSNDAPPVRPKLNGINSSKPKRRLSGAIEQRRRRPAKGCRRKQKDVPKLNKKQQLSTKSNKPKPFAYGAIEI